MQNQNRLASWALMALLAFFFLAAACGGQETQGVEGKPPTSSTTSSTTSSSSSSTTSSGTTSTSTTTSTTTTTSSSGGGAGGSGGAGTGGDPGTGGAGGDPSIGGASATSSTTTTSTTTTTSSSGGGEGGAGGAGTGGDPGTGGMGSTTSSSTSGSGGGSPVSLSCSGGTRDSAFDQFKIVDVNGSNALSDVEHVGGIWGTSPGDIFVPAATNSTAVVAHWDGMTWLTEPLPGSPMSVNDIDGTDDDHVCVAGKLNGASALFACRVNASWVDDGAKPFAKAFEGVWFAAPNDLVAFGWKAAGYFVARRTNGVWTQPVLPVLSPPPGGGYRFTRIWGLDSSHVLVTGYLYDSNSNAIQGFLLFWNGSSLSAVQSVPSAASGGPIELNGVHGTSIDDVFVTGTDGNGAGVVYHVTAGLTAWTPFTNPAIAGYGPAISIFPGTVLVGGYEPPAVPGSMRLTTWDEMVPPATQLVDAMAYNPVRFWAEPGTTTVHVVSNATGNVVAGHYVVSCSN